MAEQEKSTIAVFPNESENENAPNFTGVIELTDELIAELGKGTKLRVALWKSKSAKGLKYLSGQVQVAQEKEGKPAKSSPRSKKVVADDDEDF